MNEEAEPRARRRTVRRVVDWHQAAELLARGMTAAAVAERVGCSRAALARRRKNDGVFQGWMERCRAAAAEPEDHRLADLSQTLHEAIEKEVCAGNVRVILWLADRLKLVTPPSARTPERELRQILGSLTSEELSEFEELRDAP
jgi:transcriptional regulator with XRE-family HTH domain